MLIKISRASTTNSKTVTYETLSVKGQNRQSTSTSTYPPKVYFNKKKITKQIKDERYDNYNLESFRQNLIQTNYNILICNSTRKTKQKQNDTEQNLQLQQKQQYAYQEEENDYDDVEEMGSLNPDLLQKGNKRASGSYDNDFIIVTHGQQQKV
eukprot:Pgem_evm1s2446